MRTKQINVALPDNVFDTLEKTARTKYNLKLTAYLRLVSILLAKEKLELDVRLYNQKQAA